MCEYVAAALFLAELTEAVHVTRQCWHFDQAELTEVWREKPASRRH